MAIKSNYNFKGISIQDAYIRVDRIFGSSREGWNSLIGVYNITTETLPAIEADLDNDIEARPETIQEIFNKIDEFNFRSDYSETERGYTSLYNKLKENFGGVDC